MKKLELKNRRGQKIVGILTQPEGEIGGTAVLQHGYGSVKESGSVTCIQDALLSLGLQVFNFDTTNSIGESDGKYEDARMSLYINDFEDVVGWAQSQGWYINNLIVAGTSMGGFSALQYAANNSDIVAFAIGLMPMVSADLYLQALKSREPGVLEKWKEEGFRERESSTVPGLIRRNPWEYVLDLKKHNLLPQSHKLTMPVLLMVGDLDTWILPEHVEILFKKLPHRDKSFQIIRGAQHTMRGHGKQVQNIITEWFFKLQKPTN